MYLVSDRTCYTKFKDKKALKYWNLCIIIKKNHIHFDKMNLFWMVYLLHKITQNNNFAYQSVPKT